VLALIDGDIVAYRCAASAEGEPLEIAVLRADRLMNDILRSTRADHYKLYLSGPNNFRYDVYPEYKANRKDKPEPIHRQGVKEFLVKEWKAEFSYGCEADDMLGVSQSSAEENTTVICSIDKDLLQIPGNHYNFVKEEGIFIESFSGLRNFYNQLLMGDKSDNIPGVPQIGKVRANKYLEGCETEEDLFKTVYDLYKDKKELVTFGQCLWIWRKENDIWNPTQLLTHLNLSLQEPDHQLDS